MSPRLHLGGGDHDRANELAALRIDEPLSAADEAWLERHLAACAACAAVADEYAADRLLFAPLRDAPPAPPRDLWARTAAAIEAEAAPSRSARPARRASRWPAVLVPVAAVTAVAVVAGTLFINGTPVAPPPPGSPAATAIALDSGDVAVLTRNQDGSLEVRTAGVDEVCPISAEPCAVAEPSFEVELLAGLTTDDSVDAIISPARDRLVVVSRDATGSNGVYVMPVKTATTAATPAPTRGPAATPEPVSTAGTPAPSGEAPGSPSPAATEAPATAAASGDPVATDPAGTPPASADPAATDDPAASAPAPTDEPSVAPTDEPAATATVAVTPAPGGALEIASDVVVVGAVAAYDEKGSRFAFTARPADGSTGPDVYVWNTSDTEARRITDDHASVFAGWDGSDLLVSRVVDGEPVTVAIGPRGADRGLRGPGAWMPSLAPDGRHAIWWDGTVRLAEDGVTWETGEGRLVLGRWPEKGTEPQVLARGSTGAWEVDWADDGSAVALWTGSRHNRAGRLSVYALDGGRADVASPLLDDEPAYSAFAVQPGRLVYRAPASGGGRDVWLFGWEGEATGRVQLPDGTVIR